MSFRWFDYACLRSTGLMPIIYIRVVSIAIYLIELTQRRINSETNKNSSRDNLFAPLLFFQRTAVKYKARKIKDQPCEIQ